MRIALVGLVLIAIQSCGPAPVAPHAEPSIPEEDAGGNEASLARDAGLIEDAGNEDASSQDAGGADAGGTDAGHELALDAGMPRTFRVLFDAAHKNAVGNANWVLDSQWPLPSPQHPTNETQWSGGISAWGFDLHTTGRYDVGQLPPGAALNFGGGGAGDLSNFDVFISDEPEQAFTAAESAALMQFAQAGGGLFFVADHAGARRCSTCVEAWRVINEFLQSSGAWGVRCDGNNIAQNGLTGSPTASPTATYFALGPFGGAAALSFHSGTSVSVTGTNVTAAVVVNSTAGGMMASSSLPSGGRLVLLGDSSPADDGTCTGCSARLYDGWGEVDNARFILNASAWVAHDGS